MKKANSTFPLSATNGLKTCLILVLSKSPLLITSWPRQLLEVNSLDMSFAHWVNGSLCPLLQHTDQHSAELARLQIKTEGRGLAHETKVVICLYVPTLPMGRGGDSIYQVDPYKGAHKSKLSYCVARETRTLLNSSFHYHLFSHKKIKKKTNSKKQNNHTLV